MFVRGRKTGLRKSATVLPLGPNSSFSSFHKGSVFKLSIEMVPEIGHNVLAFLKGNPMSENRLPIWDVDSKPTAIDLDGMSEFLAISLPDNKLSEGG